MNPINLLTPTQIKRKKIIDYVMQDKFFASIMHDLNDFGHEIDFSIIGGAGAYVPFALNTEKIDTEEKQSQFVNGFLSMVESGNLKSKICLSAVLSSDVNAHYLLHEMMHFYQDMHGLFMLPLQEQGVFPILLDARGDIIAMLFCEVWAEVEAIRISWALNEQGFSSGWKGALKSPDWKDLAKSYDKDLEEGMDEKCAAANIFHIWYEGDHRIFYESHGLKIHEINLKRFKDNASEMKDKNIGASLRNLELPMLLARLPKGGIPDYFSLIDWSDKIYSEVKTSSVLRSIEKLENIYGVAANPNIQDIKCGAPPYLWNRLRVAEQKNSEIPPH